MAANVETALELGLRESAETVWARKLIVGALGPVTALVPLDDLVDAARAHALATGRAEGLAFALELIRDDGIKAEELLAQALREIGALTWDAERVVPGRVDLAFIPVELSWLEAAGWVARLAPHHRIIRPLYP